MESVTNTPQNALYKDQTALRDPQAVDGLHGEAYTFGGERPGPTVLVAGYADSIEKLLGRLQQLQSLPWMWGTLILLNLDNFDGSHGKLPLSAHSSSNVDKLLMVPTSSLQASATRSADLDFAAVLQCCSDLGMIQECGYAIRHDWASDTVCPVSS